MVQNILGQTLISTSESDWSREKPTQLWDPSRQLLEAVRHYQSCKQKSDIISVCITKLAVLQHRFWPAITGADIPLSSSLGGGLLIPHPNGIVIHPDSVIGVNCLIHQQVTFGVKRGSNKPPEIEGYVDIGPGEKIIEPILIERDVLIGTNSVVVKNVSVGSIVACIPAKLLVLLGSVDK